MGLTGLAGLAGVLATAAYDLVAFPDVEGCALSVGGGGGSYTPSFPQLQTICVCEHVHVWLSQLDYYI